MTILIWNYFYWHWNAEWFMRCYLESFDLKKKSGKIQAHQHCRLDLAPGSFSSWISCVYSIRIQACSIDISKARFFMAFSNLYGIITGFQPHTKEEMWIKGWGWDPLWFFLQGHQLSNQGAILTTTTLLSLNSFLRILMLAVEVLTHESIKPISIHSKSYVN